MKRTFVRIEKGCYVALRNQDGSIEGFSVDTDIIETTNATVLGVWSKFPESGGDGTYVVTGQPLDIADEAFWALIDNEV